MDSRMNRREIAEQAKTAGSWLAHRRAAAEIRKLLAAGDETPTMPFKLAFLSSYTVDPLADYITVEAAAHGITIETYVGGFGQLHQEILNPQSGLHAFQPDMTVLLASSAALDWPADAPTTLNDANQAAEQVVASLATLADAFASNVTGVLVPTTLPAPPSWPFHIAADDVMLAMREANRRTLETFDGNARVQVCDVDALCSYYGYRESLSPEMLSMACCPFSEMFLARLAEKVLAYVRAQKGLTRKCFVLDCDNVLWGGVVGEDGLDGIQLGPDSPGREFVEFQKTVLELFGQGVVLAINSKNNAEDVRRVLAEHPHMVLRERHFASIQANWLDKPSNMRRIAEELKLGVDSFVFIDDNPAEREMMWRMLPEVKTLEMPSNPALFARTLRETSCFAVSGLTDEDRRRGEMYAAQRQREQLRQTAVSVEEFLASLDMRVFIAPAAEGDVRRIARLTQRTNQFNLTTRRYTEADIAAFLADPTCRVYVLRLLDRFGDNGTVGLAIVVSENNRWRIDTFLLSCRVIGRQVEQVLTDRILRDAASQGVAAIEAEYIPTQKNGLVADFWRDMGFSMISESESDHRTVWRFGLSGFRPKTFPFLHIEESQFPE